jgi:hypothetical protein
MWNVFWPYRTHAAFAHGTTVRLAEGPVLLLIVRADLESRRRCDRNGDGLAT